MTCDRSLLLILLASLGPGQTASAQFGGGGGGCEVGRGFECNEIHASEGNGVTERRWLRAVILWRRDAVRRPEGSYDTAASNQVRRRLRDARRAAEDSGRAFLGGSAYGRSWHASYTGGAPRKDGDTLFIDVHALPLPIRDSALIVMVEGTQEDSANPVRIRTAWMPAEVDADYWSRRWVSGDTTFFLRPRRQAEIMRTALMRVESVRAFLEGAR